MCLRHIVHMCLVVQWRHLIVRIVVISRAGATCCGGIVVEGKQTSPSRRLRSWYLHWLFPCFYPLVLSLRISLKSTKDFDPVVDRRPWCDAADISSLILLLLCTSTSPKAPKQLKLPKQVRIGKSNDGLLITPSRFTGILSDNDHGGSGGSRTNCNHRPPNSHLSFERWVCQEYFGGKTWSGSLAKPCWTWWRVRALGECIALWSALSILARASFGDHHPLVGKSFEAVCPADIMHPPTSFGRPQTKKSHRLPTPPTSERHFGHWRNFFSPAKPNAYFLIAQWLKVQKLSACSWWSSFSGFASL